MIMQKSLSNLSYLYYNIQQIFSNDGKFYKIDTDQQKVNWHSDLGSKLIEFQIEQLQDRKQNNISTYFIPTIQGHFVYIQKNKQILVHRQQIQPLIKMCFNKVSFNGNLSENIEQQYFLYEKYQYFFLDLNNGKIWNLQKFFQDKIILKPFRHALIKVGKKFLKQLSRDLKVKWSAISSAIDIIQAADFLNNPKISIQSKNAIQEKYQFRRISNYEIQIRNIQKFTQYRVGGKSPVLAIFHHNKELNIFQRYPLKIYENSLPAIQSQQKKKKKNIKYKIDRNELEVFPHFSEYKNSNQIQKNFQGQINQKQFNFQYCLNTYRAFQQLSSISQSPLNIPFNFNSFQQDQPNVRNENFVPPISFFQHYSTPKIHSQYQKSKDQPFVSIFIVGTLIIIGVIFYRFKVNKLLTKLSKMETINDKKFQQIQQKLGKFQEMQKMYQVYWDNLLYKKSRRKCSDQFFQQNISGAETKTKAVHEIQIYQHLIFQGRFLNKQALVYAVPIQSIDLIHIQHQLNDLLSCSHKNLLKLYYYTKNSQFLLIFCEKIQPYWNSIQVSNFYLNQSNRRDKIDQTIEINKQNIEPKAVQSGKWKMKQKKNQKIENEGKSQILIKQIIECLMYLDSHIQIFSLPLQGVILNYCSQINSDKQNTSQSLDLSIYLKINCIPSILQIYKYDQQSQQDLIKARNNQNKKLRHDLVRIFYYILTKGQKINYNQISQTFPVKQTIEDQFFVKDFYDFVLNENYNLNIEILNSQDEENKQNGPLRKIAAHNQLLKQLTFHPYLWDSKSKMLFLTDFSNYLETYLDDSKIKKLQAHAKDYQIIENPWTKYLNSEFVKEVNAFRKYDFHSIKDLIRLIRNKVNHFHEIPKQIRNSVGKTPQAFIQYMLSLYPKLLSFAFVYAKRKKWKLHVQIQ